MSSSRCWGEVALLPFVALCPGNYSWGSESPTFFFLDFCWHPWLFLGFIFVCVCVYECLHVCSAHGCAWYPRSQEGFGSPGRWIIEHCELKPCPLEEQQMLSAAELSLAPHFSFPDTEFIMCIGVLWRRWGLGPKWPFIKVVDRDHYTILYNFNTQSISWL